MKAGLITQGTRSKLGENEKEFLKRILPTVDTVAEWTLSKLRFLRRTVRYPLFKSIILSEFIVKSEWGSHPIAGEIFNKKFSNNIILMKADSEWEGKVHEYDGEFYRAFRDLNDFAMHYSDYLTFLGKFQEVFLVGNPESQIKLFCLAEEDFSLHVAKLSTTRDFYSLADRY